MKIGIITFHWATNYGAILQAYALQTFLLREGYDVYIINYVPYSGINKFVKSLNVDRHWLIPQNVLSYLKEWRFKEFRNNYFRLSRKYRSFEDLQLNPPLYNVYICGSDQIWNPYFTANGEGKITTSYFLDFGPDTVKRIAYAVSFGCLQYPNDLIPLLSPILSRYKAISVREISGCQIVREMGIDHVCLMPDPTLLLREKEYKSLISSSRKIKRNYTFFYSLHSNQKTIKKIKKYFTDKLHRFVVDSRSIKNSMNGIEDWLSLIESSDIVVTNSYHGMIFSILFRIPFIVVLTEGSLASMNDRVYTLLHIVGLTDRIVEQFEEKRLNFIIEQEIDWDRVESRIDSLRNKALLYLEKNIS